MGSNTVVEISGRKVRGRLYPWGIVEGSSDDVFTVAKIVACS